MEAEGTFLVPVRIYSCGNTRCQNFGPNLEHQVWPHRRGSQFVFEDNKSCACGKVFTLYQTKEVEPSGAGVPGVHEDNPRIDFFDTGKS